MKDAEDLPPNLKPILQALTDIDEDEARSALLRREAQAKLEQTREKLLQARKDLESVGTEASDLKRNPFGRKNAMLKHLASELQATPAPILADSRNSPETISEDPAALTDLPIYPIPVSEVPVYTEEDFDRDEAAAALEEDLNPHYPK